MEFSAVDPQDNEEDRWKQHLQRKALCRDNTTVIGELPTTHADILVCLTLYNEPVQALADTLAGLARNQMQLAQRSTDPTAKIVVSIVLDGAQSVDASTADFLGKLGLNPQLQVSEDSIDASANHLLVQGQNLPVRELLAHCGQPLVDERSQVTINLLLATKRRNASKLDSHAWFFWGLGEKISARFAMQLDAGSIPGPDCLARLLQHMHDEPECGAVTTCILTPVPDTMNLAQNWQYADYLWEKVADWPIGNACRYLEVVPGQCSLIRWESFCADNGTRTPLDEYLRGLTPQGLLECNLFLAEDRVMGFELVKHGQQSSTVRYCPEAPVETDLCPNFCELVRQRRRWINSTVAARLSSVTQLPKLLGQRSIALQYRAGVLLSLCWGVIQFATQMLMPAFISLLMASGVAYVSTRVGTGGQICEANGQWAAAGFLLLWACVLIVGRQVDIGSRRGVVCHIAAISLLGIVMVSGWLMTLWGSTWQSFYFMGGTLLLLTAAVVAQAWVHLRQIGRWLVLYLLLLPVFNLYLTSYSLANFSDVSWGTKGLISQHVNQRKVRHWSRLRDRMLLAWVLASAMLVSLFLLIVPVATWITWVQLMSALIFGRIGIAALISLGSHVYGQARQSLSAQPIA